MPPKVKVTKEQIVDAAVEIVRQQGDQANNARALADMLGCSTQPIFSNFANMGQLRIAVAERAEAVCNDYIAREIASEKFPVYKASGMAYIRFAKEEKELFKFLYMRDRTGETIPETAESFDRMVNMVQANTGLNAEQTRLFHLEMWAYVHGIAAMFATGFLNLEWDLVSHMLTDAYQGLRKQYNME